MKFRHFARALGEREPASLTCKRLRRTLVPVGLKSFIRSESGTREPESSEYEKKEFTQAEAPVGCTRWNPTPEQIRILEMLYCGGMRTPHAPQIEQITAQLAKYGKIEGKNVFYWFQNHKVRERQKKKRTGLRPLPPPSPLITSPSPVTTYEEEEDRTLELFPLHPEGKIN